MFLHGCFDLPLHDADAHRHFFPFSSWQFQSPLSYWNPAHHGRLVGAMELAVGTAGSLWLWRRACRSRLKLAVALLFGLELAYWGAVAALWI